MEAVGVISYRNEDMVMIKLSRGCCEEEELQQVKEAFDYGYFGLAYKTDEFEQEIGRYLNTPRSVIATNTGTTALHLALDTIGVSQGDEVIMPSFTFAATAQAVKMCGAKPVFCEVHSDTFLMDTDDVKRKISDRTKAVIPVHYAGRPCDMDILMEIHSKTGIRIVEDAAHAFGSEYKGRKIGAFGDITCFSFDSIKVITCGDGGAVITDDPLFEELSRKKRLLGIDRKTMVTKDWKKRSWMYDVTVPGYRYHLGNINAAIGLAQIKKTDRFIQRRREICHLYDKELHGIKDIERTPDDYDTITPFMYAVRVKEGKRNLLKDYLMGYDIETGISYIPCHTFQLFHEEEIQLPITDEIFKEILCLPVHPELADEEVIEVSRRIREFMEL